MQTSTLDHDFAMAYEIIVEDMNHPYSDPLFQDKTDVVHNPCKRFDNEDLFDFTKDKDEMLNLLDEPENTGN